LSRTTFGAFYILKSQLLVGEGKPHVGLVPCSPDGGTTHVTTRHDKRRDRGRTLKRKYTVIEAAKVLGVGTDAVRKRVARGTVEHERVEDTVYVWLDDRHANGTDIRHDGSTNGDGAELLDVYRDQLDAYKDQVGLPTLATRPREAGQRREPSPARRPDPAGAGTGGRGRPADLF
jgi:hypothetical protein